MISPWSQLNNIFNADERTIYYTIKLEDVDEEFNNLIRQGDEVIDSVSKNSLGRVEVIEESPKSTELGCVKVTDENGNDKYEGKWIESHDKYDITIRVKATSDYEENVGYSVNGTRIAVGEKFYLRFPKFECTGYCTEISY